MRVGFITVTSVLTLLMITSTARAPLAATAKPSRAPQTASRSSNYVGDVTVLEMNVKTRNARIHFESGARTKWHTHEHGQILLCQEGLARTQAKGGPVLDLSPGQTTYVTGGVPHWHGASPGHSATLLSIDIGSGTDGWMDPVTDEEYNAKPRK
jgi:quercetin dioxygenase-like cupin family protein